MDIAFTINRLALRGLGTTLTSLIRNCSDAKDIMLWFLCADLHAADKERVERLLKEEQFRGRAHYIDFNAKATFGHLPALHGDWTAYGRLLIATHVPAATCVYLDADLIIRLDILCLKDISLQGNLVAATNNCPVAESLDGRFFTKQLGWSPTVPYFNSGVLILDLDKWRGNHMDEVCNAFARQHGAGLISHDQTILNAVCEGTFTHLPTHFNNAWLPGAAEPLRSKDSILHFVGSPKPWDFLGRYLHRGHHIWAGYRNAHWDSYYSTVSVEKIMRYWNIRRSILKVLLKRKKQLFGKQPFANGRYSPLSNS